MYTLGCELWAVPTLPPENVEFAQAVVYGEYRVDTHTNLGV